MNSPAAAPSGRRVDGEDHRGGRVGRLLAGGKVRPLGVDGTGQCTSRPRGDAPGPARAASGRLLARPSDVERDGALGGLGRRHPRASGDAADAAPLDDERPTSARRSAPRPQRVERARRGPGSTSPWRTRPSARTRPGARRRLAEPAGGELPVGPLGAELLGARRWRSAGCVGRGRAGEQREAPGACRRGRPTSVSSPRGTASERTNSIARSTTGHMVSRKPASPVATKWCQTPVAT